MIHERVDYMKRVQCIDGSIPENEPVFLLRGKDPYSYKLVISWADRAMDENRIDHKRYQSIINHAHLMRRWAEENFSD